MNYQGKRVNYPVLKETRAAVASGPSEFTKSFHGEERWGAKGLQTSGESVHTHIQTHTHTVHNHLSFTIQGRKHILSSSIITHIYKHWFCSERKASPWQMAFNASHFFLLPIKNHSGFWLTVARLMLKMMAAVQNRPLQSRSVHNRAMFHSFLVWYFQSSCLTSLS